MHQTWEVKPSGSGSTFSFHYALRPGVPMDEGVEKEDFLGLVRQQAQGDVNGLKALCEAEMGGTNGAQR